MPGGRVLLFVCALSIADAVGTLRRIPEPRNYPGRTARCICVGWSRRGSRTPFCTMRRVQVTSISSRLHLVATSVAGLGRARRRFCLAIGRNPICRFRAGSLRAHGNRSSATAGAGAGAAGAIGVELGSTAGASGCGPLAWLVSTVAEHRSVCRPRIVFESRRRRPCGRRCNGRAFRKVGRCRYHDGNSLLRRLRRRHIRVRSRGPWRRRGPWRWLRQDDCRRGIRRRGAADMGASRGHSLHGPARFRRPVSRNQYFPQMGGRDVRNRRHG